MSQPHRAARLEQRVHDVVEQQLGQRGWTPRVVPFTGYGSTGAGETGWVRVLARVLLAPPGTPRTARTDGRGWRRFVSTSAAGTPVTIELAGRTHHVVSGPDGYVDVRLDADLTPGWATARLRVADAAPVGAPLRVVGPTTTLGLLSDLDDTVIVTMLPRPLLALRNAMWVREDERRPVPGMAELYADVLAAPRSGGADVFVVYLSTGAWNTARPMTAFLARHGFPPGPMLMTDWGPTTDGWFRSGQDHKRSTLRRLFDELPQLQWLLVGDDGQHDPTLYAEAAAAHPDRVLGVAIRQLTLTEQLAAATAPAADPTHGEPSGAITVRAPDGHGLADALRQRGIVLGRGLFEDGGA